MKNYSFDDLVWAFVLGFFSMIASLIVAQSFGVLGGIFGGILGG